MQLDEYQSKLITDEYKPNKCVIMQATAGSGKTHVSLYKALDLANNIPPEQIVALAFGNKAAKELRIRYARLKEPGTKSIICSTIHSFGNKVLKEYFKINRTVLTEWKSQKLLRDILEDMGYKDKLSMGTSQMNGLAKEIYDNYDEFRITQQVRKSRSSFLNKDEIKEVLDRLEEEKEKNKYFDYCDMIFVCYEKLLESKSTLDRLRNDFKVFFIDEAQDIDCLQYKLITLIAKDCYTVFVGDVMQTLYMFRNAEPKYFSERYLSQVYSEVVTYPLLKNYRSVKNVVTLSNKVRKIAGDKLQAVAYKPEARGAVKLVQVRNNIQEGTKAAKSILDYLEQGYSYDDIVIICRSNNYIKSIIEPALIRENIPYTLMSSRSGNRIAEKDVSIIFFDILSILANNEDYISLYELSTYMKGIGDATANKIQNNTRNNRPLTDSEYKKYERIQKLKQDIVKLSNRNLLDPYEIISAIENICYTHLEHEKYFSNQREVQTITSAITYWFRFYLEEGVKTSREIINLIISEVQSFDDEEIRNTIKIHTVHSSKGLEFPITIVSGFNSAVKKTDTLGDEAFILYVQLSRAIEKTLIIDSYEYITKDNRIIPPYKNNTFKALVTLLTKP